MDMTEHIAPKSDQMDYDDLLGGSRVFTISDVRQGASPDQPVEVVLAEFDRPWRPAKSVRRVLVAAWGTDAKVYKGRRVELFGDPTVKWAGAAVGGIRIKALSGIDQPLTVSLTVTRGKRQPVTIQPLPDAPAPRDFLAEANAAGDNIAALRTLYTAAQQAGEPADTLAAIKALATPATPTEGPQ